MDNPFIKSPAAQDAQKCIADLETAKKAIGPVYGRLKRSFPSSTILRDKLNKIYMEMKEVQEDFAHFINNG